MTFQWGTEVSRREHGVPFLMYAPRRTHVAELLDDAAVWSERTHLVQGERRLTYAEVFTRVENTAGLLHERGVRPGDRVLLLAPNSPEWVITLWAGIRLGAVVALGNGWWSEPEVAHALGLLSPTLVVADAKQRAKLPAGTPALDVADLRELGPTPPAGTSAPDVADVRELGPTPPAGTSAPDVADVRELGPTPPAPLRPAGSEDDPAVVVFTAGTTGAPKGVTLAHRSVIANLHNLLAAAGRLPHQIDPARAPVVTLASGPLFHIGGVQSLLLALLGGSTVVFLAGRFEPGEVLRIIERERVTVWGGVPTMAARVVEHPDAAATDLSSVRSITMGGAPVAPPLLARLREYFPNARKGMSTIYGMTETGGTVAQASGALMAEHPRTAGRPQPIVDLRIESPNSDGDGEIVVRTPGQMLGYWGEDEADVLDADGFVHTGDLGRITDGLLFVTGRIKDLIIRGGENIAPAHVEAALLTHPQVRAAAVLGRPDADFGEIVGAAVELEPGATLTPDDLAAHVTPLLARFAIPALWWLLDEPLPMTDAGKTDKRALAAAWPTT